MSSRSQRARSWSSSRTGSPRGPDARPAREAWISISATSPCTSGSLRRQLGQDAPEPQRVLAERGPHPVVARRGGVALVEDEVDDLQHRRQPRAPARRRAAPRRGRCASASVRLARTMRWAMVGFRDQEGARDLVRGQAAQQAQRERHPRLGREHRMAGDEHEAQQVVADVVVERRVEGGGRPIPAALAARGPAPRACARACFRRRSWSMARCLAVAMSQAPGLSGTPDSASARARRRARPAPAPRPRRRPAPCA